MPILGDWVKYSGLLIFIAEKLSEDIWHLRSALLWYTSYMQQVANSMTFKLQKKKKIKGSRGDLQPHACPRWLRISWRWGLDSAILAAAPSKTQALRQHATLTWAAEWSFHISRRVLWRRDRREAMLRLMALSWTDSRRAKGSQDSGQTWLPILITNFRFFLHWIFTHRSGVFLKTLIIPEFSVLIKSLLLC